MAAAGGTRRGRNGARCACVGCMATQALALDGALLLAHRAAAPMALAHWCCRHWQLGAALGVRGGLAASTAPAPAERRRLGTGQLCLPACQPARPQDAAVDGLMGGQGCPQDAAVDGLMGGQGCPVGLRAGSLMVGGAGWGGKRSTELMMRRPRSPREQRPRRGGVGMPA
jgi:hypothetical protein